MQRDVSGTPIYAEVEAFVRSLWEPGFGQPLDASELAPHPDGTRVALTAQWWEALEGKPGSRIGLVDVETGDLRILTSGPNRDRLPAWSPDGRTLAFLSDRAEAGVDQLWLLDDRFGEARPTPAVDGVVESLAWSPDGSALLLVVAGRGAELAGIQGSGATRAAAADLPSWAPAIDVGDAEHHWRHLWRYDVTREVTEPLLHDIAGNVWEAVWAGPAAIAVITSDGPSESAWYDARLEVLDADTGARRAGHVPPRQLGTPSASPDGRFVAVIDALASDRAVVCGDLVVIDAVTGDERAIATDRVDVSHTAWRDATHLVLSGHRGRRTVVAELDSSTGAVTELWDTEDTCGGRVFPAAWPLGDGVVLVHEANDRPPAISLLRDGTTRPIRSIEHGGADVVRSVVGSFEAVTWTAPDGRTIEGWLALPKGDGPFPMITEVHGGPVWCFRNVWLGRNRLLPLALSRGYAVFWPNPRGSNGWGQDFVELVYGDMAGDDVLDILGGIDAVVDRYPIDAQRLGVTGGSYGGYMTYVLVTRDERFKAAVALCPISDYYSTHWSCNIPEFCRRFLADEPENPDGRYWSRSPIHDSAKCTTPMLNVVGALDRCAPTTQGEFFHRALVEQGNAPSVLVTYPEEGHGVLTYPAVFDFLTRVVGWFDGNMK